jgi:hypothetical protein
MGIHSGPITGPGRERPGQYRRGGIKSLNACSQWADAATFIQTCRRRSANTGTGSLLRVWASAKKHGLRLPLLIFAKNDLGNQVPEKLRRESVGKTARSVLVVSPRWRVGRS